MRRAGLAPTLRRAWAGRHARRKILRVIPERDFLAILLSAVLSGLLATEPARSWVKGLPRRTVRAVVLFVREVLGLSPRPPAK